MSRARGFLSLFRFRLQTLFFLVIIFAILGAWWKDHQRMANEIYRLQNPGPLWDIDQVTGVPNTPGAGDIRTAWASATPDSMREWIVVEYETAAIPRWIEIHETYNPGAVDRVSVFRDNGTEVDAWQGVDPTPSTNDRGVSKIPMNIDFPVKRIRVHIDSPKFPGWNEIDAIGMTDESRIPFAGRSVRWREYMRLASSLHSRSTLT